MDKLPELVALVRSHLGETSPEGVGPLTLPGLHLIASTALTEAQQLVYEPMLCLILEGAKETTLGAELTVASGPGPHVSDAGAPLRWQ